MSNPKTRTMAPATKPVGREDATPRYGNGSVNTYTAIGTAIYNTREKPIISWINSWYKSARESVEQLCSDNSFMELQQTYMKAIFIVFMRQNIVNGEIEEPLCKVIQNNLSIYFLSTMPTSVIKIKGTFEEYVMRLYWHLNEATHFDWSVVWWQCLTWIVMVLVPKIPKWQD